VHPLGISTAGGWVSVVEEEEDVAAAPHLFT